MKQMTCAQMGGPATCNLMISGNTAEEMVKNGMDHITQAHPDLAEQIKKMTPEETTQWMADFKVKFDAAPEM
jgi:predicted small metal-binding protein